MSDTQPETPAKSGLILKAAREEMSLSLEQVAHKLHLRSAVVRAMEDENYDEFTSDVFLKGYYRTYCRLVNLHESRMMELLDQQLLSRQKLVQQKEFLADKQRKAIKRKKIFVTVIVFFACILVIGTTYQLATGKSDVSSSPSELPSNTIISPQVPALETATNAVEDTQVLEVSETKLIDESLLNATITTTQENDFENNNQDTVAPLNDSTLFDTEIHDDLINEEESTDTNITHENTTYFSTLKAEFSGDCWFKLTDATGKTVIADLKTADEEVNFTGTAPFQIVIGDASKVSLYFEDKLVKLKPYTSNNGRAALSLAPSLSNIEG